MREIVSTLLKWNDENRVFAVARVMSTWGSAPRRPGATMLVAQDMEVVGSVSGGCIEGSVIEASLSVLKSEISQVLEFGVDNERAWSIGLGCGGRIRVLVEPWVGFQGCGIVESLSADTPFILASTVESGDSSHQVFYPDGSSLDELPDNVDLLREAALDAFSMRESRESQVDEKILFLQVFPERRRLLIIGGADITIRLVVLAKAMDFETIVVDPREVFASSGRFSIEPDQIHQKWPQEVIPNLKLDEDTFVVLLTHDPKIDDPALHLLLDQPVAYIGALGGRRTQEKRNDRLRQAGFSQQQVDRIHGPVGIDIAAASPTEIALSIMAEIIAVKNRKDPAPGSG